MHINWALHGEGGYYPYFKTSGIAADDGSSTKIVFYGGFLHTTITFFISLRPSLSLQFHEMESIPGRSLQKHLYCSTSTLIFLLSVHSQENYEAPLAAKNENMATRSKPAMEREWMQDNTNKSKEIGLYNLRRKCSKSFSPLANTKANFEANIRKKCHHP